MKHEDSKSCDNKYIIALNKIDKDERITFTIYRLKHRKCDVTDI